MEARDEFSRSLPSIMKCVGGTNNYGNIIRMIDKSNRTSFFPAYRSCADYEHVTLREMNKEKDKNGKNQKNWKRN